MMIDIYLMCSFAIIFFCCDIAVELFSYALPVLNVLPLWKQNLFSFGVAFMIIPIAAIKMFCLAAIAFIFYDFATIFI